jgi:hypothetical protein
MIDTRKYTEGKTQAELLEIQKNSVVGGDIHQAVTLEIQRIQQDTNNIQIANLIAEVRTLTEVTDKNATISDKNSVGANRLAVVAICIALASFMSQVAFSIHAILVLAFAAGTLSFTETIEEYRRCV